MNILCLYDLETGNPPWIVGIIIITAWESLDNYKGNKIGEFKEKQEGEKIDETPAVLPFAHTTGVVGMPENRWGQGWR